MKLQCIRPRGVSPFGYCVSISAQKKLRFMNCPESAVKRCLGGRQSVGGDEAGGVTSIGEGAFKLCPNLTDVYCGGSESQWKQISIDPTDNGNAPLLGAAIHYNGAVPGSREPAAENPFADSIPASFRKRRLSGPMKRASSPARCSARPHHAPADRL